MVLAGTGSYIYTGVSSTFKGGDRAADKHRALNPMITSIKFPEDMRYEIERRTTFNKLYPNIEFDKQLSEGTFAFTCHFRDPLPMSPFFTYKGVPSSWTGSGDTITYGFTNLNNHDKNIWVNMHWHDQSGNSNHLDVFLDGGQMISYKLIVAAGEPVIEEFEIKFAEITLDSPYAVDIDDGFDDGCFDQTGAKEVSTITAKAASNITTNTYFFIYLANGTGDETKYHVWFNKDAGGSDPAPSGSTAISVAVTTGQEAGTIATAIGAALDAAHDDFGTPVVSDALVTVTQGQNGDIKDIVDVDSGLTVATTTQGVTTLDGGFSNWDGTYESDECVMSSDCTLTWSTAFGDLDVEDFEITLAAPAEFYRVYSSLTAQGTYLQTRGPWECTVNGVLTKGNSNLLQPSTALASKTAATLKLQWGTTKYIQFTNAVIEEASADGLEAGEPARGSYTLKGGADSVITMSYTVTETTDPSNHITHTDVV